MIRLKMNNYNTILKRISKIKPLSSGKIDEYEYLSGKEILPFDQKKIIQKAKFSYSPLIKAFKKQ